MDQHLEKSLLRSRLTQSRTTKGDSTLRLTETSWSYQESAAKSDVRYNIHRSSTVPRRATHKEWEWRSRDIAQTEFCSSTFNCFSGSLSFIRRLMKSQRRSLLTNFSFLSKQHLLIETLTCSQMKELSHTKKYIFNPENCWQFDLASRINPWFRLSHELHVYFSVHSTEISLFWLSHAKIWTHGPPRLLTTSFLTRASLSVTISLSSAITCRSSGRLSLFLNFSSVPSNLDAPRKHKEVSKQEQSLAPERQKKEKTETTLIYRETVAAQKSHRRGFITRFYVLQYL